MVKPKFQIKAYCSKLEKDIVEKLAIELDISESELVKLALINPQIYMQVYNKIFDKLVDYTPKKPE